MALFGTRKNVLQTLTSTGWASTEERDALLAELRKAPPKAAELIPLLVHRDGSVRAVSAQLFIAHADAAAARALIVDLSHQPANVRAAIQPLLGQVPASVVREALDAMVGDENAQNRRLAWEVALAVPGAVRGHYLERAVLEAPSALRYKAVEEILRAGHLEKRLDLLIKLSRDEDAKLAEMALQAVAQVRDPRVLEMMLQLLAGGGAAARGIADQYLRRELQADPTRLRQALLDLLPRGTDETRRAAIRILIESGSAEQAVMEILQLGSRLAGWMRLRIAEALRACGEPVLRAAVKLMQHTDQEVRTSALMLAEGFADQRLLEPFCRALSDADWWLRVSACQVLGNLKDERAVPYLVRVLPDEDTRWAAVDALAQIAAPAALQPLSQLLKDPRNEVRLEVLQAFSRFSDPRLVPVLKAVRERDPAHDVRERAAAVLTQITGEESEAARGATPALERPLDKLLARVRELGASDLHVTVGEPPLVRIDGVLQRMEGVGALSAEHTRSFIYGVLDEAQSQELTEHQALDFCHVIEGVGRYRANAYVQRLGVCASFRVIPNRPPTFQELGLPNQLRELLDFHQGVIIVSGPSGCGKSTTLTALVNLINETKPLHVITLEDPIEFVHPPKQALINQRQVGRDSRTFASGLRAALREDPDIIVVGELRDTDTIRMALEAAETGHLMIGTLHTTSAVQTIDRLVDSFPSDEKAQVRMALSESLKYVVCQRLVPHKSGKGRVAVFEVLKGTVSVGSVIRRDETYQLPGLMQIGRQLGMRLLDQSLMELVEAEKIAPESAWRIAAKPATFEPLCNPDLLAREEAPA